MASFPRWIDDRTVDSAVMYGGFLGYYNKCVDAEELASLKELFMVLHGHYDFHPFNWRWKACETPHCQRCAMGSGGYKFRWYDARWYEYYAKNARAGAWLLNNKRQGLPIAQGVASVSTAMTVDGDKTSASLLSPSDAE